MDPGRVEIAGVQARSRTRGEVYNSGGGRTNSISILEGFGNIVTITRKATQWGYVDENGDGDHICYISAPSKGQAHYPGRDITESLDDLVLRALPGRRLARLS